MDELEVGYDQMSDKFSNTRSFFWKDLAFIADYIENGSSVLDFGCGNGRLLEILKDKKIDYTGIDISQKLIDLAKTKYPENSESFLKVTSQDSLAFSDNFFNNIIAIAVFHHFPKDYANKMAEEFYRIAKPGGIVIITVWNLWQRKYWKNIFNFSMLKRFFQSGRFSGFGFRDIFVPFQNNGNEVFNRYHRVYTKKELADIFVEAGFEIERCSLVNNRNIIIIARKK